MLCQTFQNNEILIILFELVILWCEHYKAKTLIHTYNSTFYVKNIQLYYKIILH